MMTPVAVATWIAFCLPWADTKVASALVAAGSGGEPYLVTDSTGKTFVGKTAVEAANHARSLDPKQGDIFLGLTQVPLSRLRATGLTIEDGLDKCGSLESGYQGLLQAYSYARTVEKTPVKTLAAAFSYYRNNVVSIDLPYAKTAAEYMLAGKPAQPAPMGSMERTEMIAEWAAGLAQRMGHRAQALHAAISASPFLTQLGR